MNFKPNINIYLNHTPSQAFSHEQAQGLPWRAIPPKHKHIKLGIELKIENTFRKKQVQMYSVHK